MSIWPDWKIREWIQNDDGVIPVNLVRINPASIDLGWSGRHHRGNDAQVLMFHIHAHDLPQPQLEHRFHDTRRWRFDFAWPEQKIALEIDGGIWMRTEDGRSKGHAHPVRFVQDCEKMNEAAILGWRVLRATPQMVKDGTAVGWLERILQ